ncbi:MAG: polynucleotide adenylyltransferase PcnB [Gammaproteobacteria bacterium]|nr:polynucleotide adenylyltransferase PcnB [Gammaproteobacteria bacterium]
MGAADYTIPAPFETPSFSLLKRITEHDIDRTRVSEKAVTVIDKLRGAGFDAYLVGGCVRDLLLGKVPKDFDVATAATPEDVRKVFPRVRLVGRRFRIVHVRVGREIIEVSTFRRAVAKGDDHGPHVSDDGMIIRDNLYGTIDQDAFRRDFTVNALYYDPSADVVLDYCEGMKDISSRTLRLIGEPETRFQEDPVRILRAIRFAAKLDLELHPDTEAAIAPMCEMLNAIPPARLFDEFTKLFLTGHGERSFELLYEHDLVEILFPLPPHGQATAKLALASTDQRLRENKPVTPGFLIAAFLWQEYLDRLEPTATAAPRREDDPASTVIAAQQSTIAIPRRHGWFVRDVWHLQPLLARRTARDVARVLAHRRFRAAYDFLMIRCATGDAPQELGDWWTNAQTENTEALLRELPSGRPRRRRRRRGRNRPNRDSAKLNAANGGPGGSREVAQP